MKLNPSDIIKIELNAFKIEYPFIGDFKATLNKKLIDKVKSMLDKNISLRYIKAYIRKELEDYYKSKIKLQLLQLKEEQLKSFEINPNANIKNALVFGLSLDDLIKSRINTHFKSLLQLATTPNLNLNDINKIKKANTYAMSSLTYNYLKANRNLAYEYIEMQYKSDIKGWLYSAILDRRTSTICLTLNNKFYEFKRYKKRSNLPYIPNINTHINCRSMLLTIYNGEDISKYKNKTLDEFLKSEPYEAKKLLGEKRYKLYKENKLKAEDLINFKQKKFYPIKDLIKSKN
jgi:hypothetical protein